MKDYINPVIYGMWTDMKKSFFEVLKRRNQPLSVTGDGQEILQS
jgi:hypothetical protein